MCAMYEYGCVHPIKRKNANQHSRRMGHVHLQLLADELRRKNVKMEKLEKVLRNNVTRIRVLEECLSKIGVGIVAKELKEEDIDDMSDEDDDDDSDFDASDESEDDDEDSDNDAIMSQAQKPKPKPKKSQPQKPKPKSYTILDISSD